MKYGINGWYWVQPFKTEDIGVVKRIAALGFNWIEVSIETVDQPLDYETLGAAIKDNGLGVSICAYFSGICDLTVSDAAQNKAAFDYMTHCVDAAAAMGCKVIGGPFYSTLGRFWHPPDRKRALEIVAKHLKPMGKYAEGKGVVFAIEPINRYETSFINTAEQGLELVDMVDSPGVQLMLDSFHMGMEEKDLGEAIELAGEHLVHIHSNEHDRGVPGSGHTDWQGMATALKKINYDGALVVESFSYDLKDFAGLTKIWRPIVANEQDFVEGVNFLKKTFG
jgi:D-psicose/D-tagatose/L-ribulose 3-epimerase